MRTTVDIPELLLRRVRARAALDGKAMKDVVNEALRLYLDGETGAMAPMSVLPRRIAVRQFGRVSLPVIPSKRPGAAEVNAEMLKNADDLEDVKRHASVFGR